MLFNLLLLLLPRLHYVHICCSEYFLGGSLELSSSDIVYSPADRYRLRTQAAGSVYLDVSVILRNFDKYGVEL